jgi:hypothetical protein
LKHGPRSLTCARAIENLILKGKVKASMVRSVVYLLRICGGASSSRLDLASAEEAQTERTGWDPKDGELCEARSKPEETLVEDCSGSNVQIDRRSFV